MNGPFLNRSHAPPPPENWAERLAVRSGHSVTVAGAQVLLFGGRLSTEDCLTAQLLRLDRDRMNWHAQVTFLRPCYHH